MFESKRRTIIDAVGGCFLYVTFCAISKPESLKIDSGRKVRPSFALFDPLLNIGEG